MSGPSGALQTCRLYDNMKFILWRHIGIEEVMKKQILQLFHNLMGKKQKPDGKTDEDHLDPGQFHDAVQAESDGSSGEDVSDPVRMIDRRTFERLVNESLAGGRSQGCLLIGDVDRCRDINNIYGSETGDAVLHNTASVLCDIFAGHARIGSQDSDMFAFWLSEMTGSNADAIRKMTGMVNDKLLHPEGELPPSSLSVGLSFCESGDDCRSLFKKAYKALYIVKESGRCGCEMSL